MAKLRQYGGLSLAGGICLFRAVDVAAKIRRSIKMSEYDKVRTGKLVLKGERSKYNPHSLSFEIRYFTRVSLFQCFICHFFPDRRNESLRSKKRSRTPMWRIRILLLTVFVYCLIRLSLSPSTLYFAVRRTFFA